MSLESELNEYRRKRKKKEENTELRKNNYPGANLLYNSADIAPVGGYDYAPVGGSEKEEETDDRTYFKAGAFEDGYQFGDVLRTVGASATDISASVVGGILDIGEGVVDAGASLVAGVGGIFSDDFQEDVEGFIEKDLYEGREVAKYIVGGLNPGTLFPDSEYADFFPDPDEDSIFGEKSRDALASLGQYAAQLGLTAVTGGAIPWWVIPVVTGYGGEVENALNQDATLDEAAFSGLITGGAEALFEKLSGGIKFGGKALDDALTKQLASKISNKFVRNGLKIGIDMAGEGAEEWLTEDVSRFGQWLTYQDDKTLAELLYSEEAMDAKIEAFIGGAFVGGVVDGGRAVKSTVTGRDATSGLTANEEKVFNHEYEKRLAEEAEAKGEKLTSKEKNKIYDETMQDLQKGRIDIDTIESVLGGESYKTYQDTINNEDALIKEYEELRKMKKGEMNDIQQDRLAELKAMNLTDTSKRDSLKAQLSENVQGMLTRQVGKRTQSDNYLLESYAERGRRSEAFNADTSKYKGAQAEVVQKAIDSGVLNNTRRTHEFVDLISKISADKGVLFDFTNNQKLKESGFAVDGASVNGFVTKDGITLNMDSHKAWQSTVGHEITHVLEGTELYTELQNAIKAYAESKGEYQSRYDSITALYKDVEGANVDAELTADLVGEYLFTDEAFVQNLSAKNRNVFQKIYDELKYLLKVATTGSKEARELEKVKRAFDKAYKAEGKAQKNTADDSGAKYDIVNLEDGKVYVEASRKVIKGTTVDEMRKDISQFFSDLLGDNPSLDIHTIEGDTLTITKAETADKARDNYQTVDGERVKMTDDEFAVKMHIESHIDDVAEVSTPIGKMSDNKNHSFAKDGFTYRRAYFKDFDGQYYEVTLSIGNNGTVATVYNVGKIKEGVPPSAKIIAAVGSKPLGGTPSANRIPQNEKNVKRKFSLSSDSDGKQLSKGQREYFKDSKMRDENGNLKVMYHGSQDAGFHVFDPSMSDDGTSLFFVDRNDVAASYSGTTETYEAQSIRTAEDMNRFIESIGAEGYEVVENDGKFTLLYEGDRVADSNTAKGIYEEFCWYEGVGEGDANYKVYLNLTNPLEVDAEGRNWNNISREFSQEVADRYNSLTAEEKETLTQLASWEEISIFRDEIDDAVASVENGKIGAMGDPYIKNLASAHYKLDGANIYDVFAIASDGFSAESINQFAVKQMNTRDYAQKAKAEGYDGVIFKNIVDVGGYSNGDEGASTVAIAFDSNQVKSVANGKPTKNADIRYSLTEYTAEEKKAHNDAVLKHFGKTYKWAETGYLLLDGSKLDLSGKHDGAPGGYRTVDHRDITDALGYDYGGDGYSDSLVQFMSEGNIRIVPEINGINLSVKPTKAQEQALSDYISRYRGEVVLDIDDLNGNTVVSVEYPKGTYYAKVLNDIREWFDNGKKPEMSEFSPFRSLTKEGEKPRNRGYATPLSDLRLQEDIAPVAETAPVEDIAPEESVTEKPIITGDYAPQADPTLYDLENERAELERAAQEAYAAEDMAALDEIAPKYNEVVEKIRQMEKDDAEMQSGLLNSLDDADAPPETEAPYYGEENPIDPFADRDVKDVRHHKAYMYENPEVKPFFQAEANVLLGEWQRAEKPQTIYNGDLKYDMNYDAAKDIPDLYRVSRNVSEGMETLLDTYKMSYADIKKGLDAIIEDNGAENIAAAKKIEFLINDRLLNGYNAEGVPVPANVDYKNLVKEKAIFEYSEEARAKLFENGDDIAPMAEAPKKASKSAENVEGESSGIYETPRTGQMSMFKEADNTEKPIKTVKDRLQHKLNSAYGELSHNKKLRRESLKSFDGKIANLEMEYAAKKNKDTKVANDILRRIERYKRLREDVDADYTKRINDNRAKVESAKAKLEEGYSEEEGRTMRSELHARKIDEIKNSFSENGLDFDDTLKNAKDLSTFKTVDNTPQRVMEKSLGYKGGQVLADLTVNKVAQNETEGIKWLNSITSRHGEGGLLKQLSKKYHIKPGSKESAAAQMYAEGFYVDENSKKIKYGDEELAKDFPNAETQKNIKGLASDPRIRQFYDDTLAQINESRTRNAYPEIKLLDNYFLHFRAMEDTFSRMGIPFNPNDIKAKDLPTDLNGVTADLKPGQPYFASAMHRRGNKTTYDLLGGIERYATGAKNQIYHIDDIQTLRALRNYIADTYGQANGLENLDNLSEEETQDRIKQVYNAHLSTFAKFLNEEANVIAGKTALIDRGLEGIIGRRGIQFLDTVNKQVGSNMVGGNVSSAGTNFLPIVQAFAKTNKTAFVKGFAQTVANKVGHVFGKADSFADNPTAIRRKGADRFSRTPWQKAADAGYALMGAVDNISTEVIVRAKYNEFIEKGMSEQQAITEADKWASRLIGDRSLGQMPQLYNSKMLGMITKFQLEVRNQLDSQFYDTIQETKASNEDIENAQKRNAKTAAKVAATFAQLAIAQHIFGKVFESIAGYNPAFDIIDVLIKALGFDDEEDSEDTALDNVEQSFLALLEDLPYTSTFTGGRIPISSALPIKELVTGKDDYGNEKSRLETLGEIAPYYALPTGYGQLKKTVQGLSMFSGDHPVSGSYTGSGNLRFPVEDTLGNRMQAGLFGQWASDNARYYFDNDIAPLKEKQIQEFADVDMPIKDYWKYRKGLSKYNTISEKADYINSLDLSIEQKNILINNIADRKEPIDMSNYTDFNSYEEFDFAMRNPEKYSFFKENGISYETYAAADEDGKRAYTWAYENPGGLAVAKAVTGDIVTYRKYASELYDIKADKDASGKSITGSRKEKVIDYVNNLDIDYGARLIIFKSEYNADDTYNYDIIDYLNSREDISYEDMVSILKELGFTVDSNGNIYW